MPWKWYTNLWAKHKCIDICAKPAIINFCLNKTSTFSPQCGRIRQHLNMLNVSWIICDSIHYMYGITNNMEQQHGTFEIRLYQNSRQLGISVRRIFNLPYTTHTRFLPHILEISKVTDQIYGHFLKMVKTM